MLQGIVFDKDGTLVEFSKAWKHATVSFLQQFSFSEEEYQETLNEIGLVDGQPIPNSPIASGTSSEMAEVIAKVSGRDFQEVLDELRSHYFQWTQENPQDIIPLTDLKKLFLSLKEYGLKIGIATADDYDVTIWTCKYLGIYELIDFFGTSEVYSAKPNDEMLLQFCREMDLTPDQVIHVGDSVADMEFALHCRAGVGVLSGIGTEQELIHHTEHIIPSIKELVPLLDATFY